MHPRSRRTAARLVALVVVGLGLLACGGDDGGDDASDTTAPAGDLCALFADLRTEVGAANEVFQDPDASDEEARDAVATIFAKAEVALEALPAELEEDATAVRAQLDDLEERTADADADELRVVLPVEMSAIFLPDTSQPDTPASRILDHTSEACPQG